MPKLIDQAVKLEIIKLHLEGKGRNFIAESVTGVSSGTVSNVIKQYQKQPSETKKSDRIATFTEETSAEVEVKKNPDISIEDHLITNTQDFEKNGYALENPLEIGHKGAPLSWFTTTGTEIQTPQTRSEQVQLEEKIRQKEQIENDIVILNAEKSLLEDRIDKGYRVIDTYKKIAADFSVVKQEMADAGMTFTDSILFKSIVGIFKKHNYSSAKIMHLLNLPGLKRTLTIISQILLRKTDGPNSLS